MGAFNNASFDFFFGPNYQGISIMPIDDIYNSHSCIYVVFFGSFELGFKFCPHFRSISRKTPTVTTAMRISCLIECTDDNISYSPP